MNLFDSEGGLTGAQDQFRLTRIQTFNWGTFSGVFDFVIPREGYLFVGPSGSGKSTVLDAHAALLTPPKWVDFNTAASGAEKHGRDRNVMTYLRGAYAQRTGEDGEFVSQYLRPGTTWSAIAETYRTGNGRCVVLAQVLWVVGSKSAPGEAHRRYLVLERELDLQELEFFAQHNEFQVRRFKTDLPDASVYEEFSAYQERFRRLLGIENERALRLLHKTQSAKNLGDLNGFLRDFMLDAPETFVVAERLVNDFGELHAAHQAVVAARQQIEVLKPARDAHAALQQSSTERLSLSEVAEGVEHYQVARRRTLLDEHIAEMNVDLEGSRQQLQLLAGGVETEAGKLDDLRQRRIGMGGGVLEQLQREAEATEAAKPERMRKRDLAAAACHAMGWAVPDTVVWFVQRVDAARQYVHKGMADDAELEAKKDALKVEKNQVTRDFQAVVTEVRAMERQSSNIPARLLGVRAAMAGSLGVPENKLPFVGELLEVKPESLEWQGAIERVLGGFSTSILVDEANYAAVSTYLNEHNTNQRVAYHRMSAAAPGNRSAGPASIVRRLNFAHCPQSDWLRDELKKHYDYECAESPEALRAASRGVTRQGQVKHSTTSHVKDDRSRVDDRSNWTLGFDNKAKLELFQAKAADLGARLASLEAEIGDLAKEKDAQRERWLHCQTLANMRWAEIDVGELLTRIADLTGRIQAEKAARPDLSRLDEDIQTQTERAAVASKKRLAEDVRHGTLAGLIAKAEVKRTDLERLFPVVRVTPLQQTALDTRYSKTDKVLTLENLDDITRQVDRAIAAELRQLDARMAEAKNAIVLRFDEFNRRWPAESGGPDATMASADDYLAKLLRLETDGLPTYEERFHRLMREQSDQNLTMLSTQLDHERSAIRSRMELVNESLRGAPFGAGTHLVIETHDKSLEEVRLFRAALKEALSHSFSSDAAVAEQQFTVLSTLVNRLGSQDTSNKNWKALVLDVRQHVEFVARELDEDDIEIEVYRSGAGKSGGQRQKLAATCLAAALRYQLGGQDRMLPSFSTVVLDEAFDKADADFTAMAMNIFKTFGFQMIVATPLKSVMTLEPFIGGACFVTIKDRQKSGVIAIEYDTEAQRLKLSPEIRHVEAAAVS